MEGVSMLVGAVMLLSGAILLPTSEKTLGIFFMTLFWAPYGLVWSCRRIHEGPPLKRVPTAPVFTGPLPIATGVEEDPV